MGIHDGHRQRCRDRYCRVGEKGFDDHQLLELLLFYAIPRRDTNELAHQLLNRFGSLKAVLHASIEELSSVPGMGSSAASLIRLVYDISSRAQQPSAPKEELKSFKQAGDYFFKLLHELREEKLYVAFLDVQGRLISCRCISEGAVSSTPIEVRPIVAHALYLDAASIILAHNCPDSFPLPSVTDIISTQNVQKALTPLHIKVNDHIIVSNKDYLSLARAGGWGSV